MIAVGVGVGFGGRKPLSVVPGFDDADMVDDGRELDHDMQIDDEKGVEEFLSLLFGIDSKLVEVD